MKPLFIVFEGMDGSGKSTQVRLLAKYLENQGKKVCITRQPGGTIVGTKIRELVLHSKDDICPITELLLYKADEAQHVNFIKSKLEEGYIVISDRFCYSATAYQSFGRGLDLNIINQIEEVSVQNLQPDFLFIMKADVEKSVERSREVSQKFDRFESLNLEFHKKVQEGFLTFALYSFAHVLDATKSIDQIHQEIISKIEKNIE